MSNNRDIRANATYEEFIAMEREKSNQHFIQDTTIKIFKNWQRVNALVSSFIIHIESLYDFRDFTMTTNCINALKSMQDKVIDYMEII